MPADPTTLSLRGLDIVVSYRESGPERRDNLYTVLRHLAATYADYTVWLMEGAPQPRFDWPLLADARVRHVFVPHDGPFPKALLYNLGAKLASGPLVCFHDADCIARPEYLLYCIERMLSAEGSDALGVGLHAMCPFQSMINIAGDLKRSFAERPDFALLRDIGEQGELPADATVLYPYNVGGVFLFRRKVYLGLGGCNPAIEGWGSEDNELFARATRLGANWQVVSKPLYHLHHDSKSRDGVIASEHAARNKPLELASAEMPLDELRALADRLAQALR